MDRQLRIEIVEELKYVDAQAQGSRFKASVKDGEMVNVWLSAGALRHISQLVKEVDRIARDKAAIKARKKRKV